MQRSILGKVGLQREEKPLQLEDNWRLFMDILMQIPPSFPQTVNREVLSNPALLNRPTSFRFLEGFYDPNLLFYRRKEILSQLIQELGLIPGTEPVSVFLIDNPYVQDNLYKESVNRALRDLGFDLYKPLIGLPFQRLHEKNLRVSKLRSINALRYWHKLFDLGYDLCTPGLRQDDLPIAPLEKYGIDIKHGWALSYLLNDILTYESSWDDTPTYINEFNEEMDRDVCKASRECPNIFPSHIDALEKIIPRLNPNGLRRQLVTSLLDSLKQVLAVR